MTSTGGCLGHKCAQSVVERLCPQAANYFGLCSGWADRAGQTHRGHPKNPALRRQAVAWEVIEMSVYTFPPFRTHVFASGPPLALVVVCNVVWHVTLWEVGAHKHTQTQTKTEGAARAQSAPSNAGPHDIGPRRGNNTPWEARTPGLEVHSLTI